jgi:protein-S-isoprenylcysteine O-methyltransferase Ste14
VSRHADLILRILLPCYFLLYILVGWVFAVARVKRRYGVDPMKVRDPDPITSLGESYRNGLFAVALAIVLVNSADPGLLAWLGPIPYLRAPLVQWTGLVLLVASLALLRVAQIQMKGSWRFGCDRSGAPTELITTGLFARSRNPIYVGMNLTAAGLFLALPNAVTFSMANLTLLLLQVRVRVEEEYLKASHGEAYAAYCRRTPRWLLRLGHGG